MSPRLLLRTSLAFAALLIFAQDPDGGAGRGRPLTSYRPSVPGVRGLVTAGHPLAAMAGMTVLQKGGNAIDAAVAVGAAMTMMEPQMNGIGGNGFMTIYGKKTGKVYSLAMAGAAPMATDPAKLTAEELNYGINAGTIPANFGGYLAFAPAMSAFETLMASIIKCSASGLFGPIWPMS